MSAGAIGRFRSSWLRSALRRRRNGRRAARGPQGAHGGRAGRSCRRWKWRQIELTGAGRCEPENKSSTSNGRRSTRDKPTGGSASVHSYSCQARGARRPERPSWPANADADEDQAGAEPAAQVRSAGRVTSVAVGRSACWLAGGLARWLRLRMRAPSRPSWPAESAPPSSVQLGAQSAGGRETRAMQVLAPMEVSQSTITSSSPQPGQRGQQPSRAQHARRQLGRPTTHRGH